MKVCSKCNEAKPLEAFNKDKAKKDGRRPNCKACRKVQTAAYYKAHREALRERDAAYRANNPAKRRASSAKSSCGKAAPSWLTDQHHEDIIAVYEEADALGYHVDHIVPRSHPLVSGLHVPANLQVLSPELNGRKHNFLPFESQYSFIHLHDGKAYDSTTGQLVSIGQQQEAA